MLYYFIPHLLTISHNKMAEENPNIKSLANIIQYLEDFEITNNFAIKSVISQKT